MPAKYVGLRKADGGEIPEGEPYWVFRARDVLAIPCLKLYADLAEEEKLPRTFLLEIYQHIARITEWQRDHPPKLPD